MHSTNPRGNHPSATSGTPIPIKQKAEPQGLVVKKFFFFLSHRRSPYPPEWPMDMDSCTILHHAYTHAIH